MSAPHASPDDYRDEASFLRSKHGPPIACERTQSEGRHRAEIGSQQMRRALERHFAKWEREHGFRPGAGQILLPAGWRE